MLCRFLQNKKLFIKVALFWFCIVHLSLCADVFNHIKPCDGKEEGAHSFGSIDCVYLINLDHRSEKLEHSLEQCGAYNIYPYRFSAINGHELSLEQLQDIGLQRKRGIESCHFETLECTYYIKQGKEDKAVDSFVGDPAVATYFCRNMKKGAIGVALSHLSILQDAYDSGYQIIWVMEDDIVIHQHPDLILQEIENLNRIYSIEGWDILFTDPDSITPQGERLQFLGVSQRPNKPMVYYNPVSREPVSEGVTTIRYRFGAYSMVITRAGIKKILDFYKNNDIFYPYDIDINLFEPNIKMFSFDFDVVTSLVGAQSDNY